MAINARRLDTFIKYGNEEYGSANYYRGSKTRISRSNLIAAMKIKVEDSGSEAMGYGIVCETAKCLRNYCYYDYCHVSIPIVSIGKSNSIDNANIIDILRSDTIDSIVIAQQN